MVLLNDTIHSARFVTEEQHDPRGDLRARGEIGPIGVRRTAME